MFQFLLSETALELRSDWNDSGSVGSQYCNECWFYHFQKMRYFQMIIVLKSEMSSDQLVQMLPPRIQKGYLLESEWQ